MPAHNRRLLTGLLIGFLGVSFQAFGVVTAMPVAVRDLNAIQLYAWAFSTFVMGMVMSIVIAGRVTDNHGPAKPMIAGFSLFMVGLATAMLAPNIYVLIVARLIQGIGGGALNLTLFVLVAQLFDERQRSQLMALLAFLWVLPAFLGPPLAAWIAEHQGWRWVFGWSLVPMVVCFVLAVGPLLRVPVVEHEHEPDPVPIWAGVTAAVSAAAIQLAGQQLNLLTIPILALGIVGLVVSIPRIMPRGFVRAKRGLPAVMWVRALQSGTFFGAESFIPLMLIELRHLDVVWASLALTIGSLGWTVGSWAQSRPWFRLRRDQMISFGAVFTVAGIALIVVFALIPHTPLLLPAVGWVLTGAGMGMSQANTSLAVMGLSESHVQGRNTSSLQVAEGLGIATLTGIAGSVFAGWHNAGMIRLSFVGLYVTLLVSAVICWGFTRRIGTIPNRVANA